MIMNILNQLMGGGSTNTETEAEENKSPEANSNGLFGGWNPFGASENTPKETDTPNQGWPMNGQPPSRNQEEAEPKQRGILSLLKPKRKKVNPPSRQRNTAPQAGQRPPVSPMQGHPHRRQHPQMNMFQGQGMARGMYPQQQVHPFGPNMQHMQRRNRVMQQPRPVMRQGRRPGPNQPPRSRQQLW